MARHIHFAFDYVSKFFFILFLATTLQSCFSDGDETELETEEPTELAVAEAADQTAAEESPDSSSAEPEAPANASPSEGMEAGASAEEVAPTDSSTSVDPSAGQSVSSSASTSMLDPSGKRVLYVSANKAVMRDGPTESAKIIKKLRKGDHFLFSVEGEWAKTDEGGYVSMKNLSEKGVGRKKSKPKWK